MPSPRRSPKSFLFSKNFATNHQTIVSANILVNLYFSFQGSALLTPRLSTPATSPGTLPWAKERRAVAFLMALSCRRPVRVSPTVHQAVPSLKNCNKKRAAISCNAYFGAPSVGALRIQSCGLNLATSPRELNASRRRSMKPSRREWYNKKAATICCGFFWCTIGDSPAL